MIPTELALRNFMCYREDSDGAALKLSFDGLHVVCLSGENGAGKSALLDAITWALWGRARTSDDDLIAQGASEMFVELTFQLGTQQYRVTRRRQRGRTGPRGGQAAGKGALDIHLFDGNGWKPIAEATIRETQDRITDLLRMSYDTFINASFLLQGRADEFTARTPAERKQVLADILDLGVYARLEERAKLRARTADDQLKGLRGRIENVAQQADQVPFWQQKVAEAEQRVSDLAGRVAQVQAERERLDLHVRALEAQAAERKAIVLRLGELRTEQTRREGELTTVKTRISAAEALLARRTEISAGIAALAAAQAERERLEEVRGQFFALDQERAALKQELREALNSLKLQQAQAEQRLEQLRTQAEQRANLASSIAEGEAQITALRPLMLERNSRAALLQEYESRLQQMHERQRAAQHLDERIALRHAAIVKERDEAQRLVQRLEAQLADEPRWHNEQAIAQTAAAQLRPTIAQIEALRRQSQAAAEQGGEQRAICKQLKEQAEQVKARQAMLGTGTDACPVCLSPLDADGQHRVDTHYTAELQTLRERYVAARQAAEAGDAQAEQLQRELGAAETQAAQLQQQAATLDRLNHQLAQSAAWRDELVSAQTSLAEREAQLAEGVIEPSLQAERVAVLAELAALGDQATLSHERQMIVERLREIDQNLRTGDQVEGKLSAQREALRQADLALAELPAAEATLQALSHQIGSNDFAHAVRQRGREVETAIAELAYSDSAYSAAKTHIQTLTHWDAEQRELARAEERLTADQTICEQYVALQHATNQEIGRLSADADRLERELYGLPQIMAQADEQARQVQELMQEQQSTQNDLGQKQGYLQAAEHAARELAIAQAELRTLDAHRNLFGELAEACGKKGVQAMLIETAIPQIEDEANRLLARMTDNQMHLSLETQSETKKGDPIETLEIKIADALGTRVYDAFSGGEALRANFAVRIALSRLLARRAGARLETLVIDEGFGALDAMGRERMVEAITTVQADFRRIVVITHIDELKDRFPATIEVSKTPLGSYWELR